MTDAFNTLDSLSTAAGKAHFASLKKLETALGVSVARLPVSIRIVLESVLRNCDGMKVTPEHVKQLAGWQAKGARTEEIETRLGYHGGDEVVHRDDLVVAE